jgi:hypothetical protein
MSKSCQTIVKFIKKLGVKRPKILKRVGEEEEGEGDL